MNFDALKEEISGADDLTEVVKSAIVNVSSFLDGKVTFPEVYQDDDGSVDLRWVGERARTAFSLHFNQTRTIAVYTDLRPGKTGYGVALEDFDHLATLLRDPRIDFCLEKKPS